ncbi:hypothetical protein AB0D46_15560 [Streptomyces sp. NPDC048383]
MSSVVLTHTITPPLPIERATGPSEIIDSVVKSTWPALAAGESDKGEIIA